MAVHSLIRLRTLTGAVAIAGTVILTAAGQPPPPGPFSAAQPQIGNLKLPKLELSPLAAPSPKDDPIQKLRKERYMAAFSMAEAQFQAFQAGTVQGTIDQFAEAHLEVLQTELDLRPSPSDRIAMLERRVDVAAFSEKVNEIRFNKGRIPIADFEQTKYSLFDAQIKLLEAKQEAANGGRK